MADKVFDLDAFVVEATRGPFQFQFGGEIFEIAGHYDPRVWRRIMASDFGGALGMMLDDEQLARLDAIDKAFDAPMFLELLRGWAEHCGTDPGEATASSRSSRRAGAKSKPTSNGSTDSRSRSS